MPIGRRVNHALVVLMACALVPLAACQDMAETAGKQVDAPGVTVSLEPIEGAPEAIAGKVTEVVATQAQRRKIDVVASGEPADYRLKGYLTAYATEEGDTALTFVWDVFDSSQRRAQRVTSTTMVHGHAADPWDKVAEPELAKVVSQGMNEVAGFLAGSPATATASAAVPSASLGFSGQH